MSFNYYSFDLYGKEYIFYTSRRLSENEVLEYAEGFSFIEESEISQCTNEDVTFNITIPKLSLDEIKKRNKELYIKWWADREEGRLNGEDVSYLLIPPTIGTVQLD